MPNILLLEYIFVDQFRPGPGRLFLLKGNNVHKQKRTEKGFQSTVIRAIYCSRKTKTL